MPARFFVRQAPAVPAGFAGGLNRVDDPSVAGAAAQMPVECLRDHAAIVGHALPHQRRGADDDPGDAEPALHAAFEHKRFAQHAARVVRKALDGDDVMAGHLFRFPQAGQRRVPVDQDQAAAAGAFRRAAVLGGHHAALFAQHLEEVHPGLVRGLGDLSIQVECDARHPTSS